MFMGFHGPCIYSDSCKNSFRLTHFPPSLIKKKKVWQATGRNVKHVTNASTFSSPARFFKIIPCTCLMFGKTSAHKSHHTFLSETCRLRWHPLPGKSRKAQQCQCYWTEIIFWGFLSCPSELDYPSTGRGPEGLSPQLCLSISSGVGRHLELCRKKFLISWQMKVLHFQLPN